MPKVQRSGNKVQVLGDDGFALHQFNNVPETVPDAEIINRYSKMGATVDGTAPPSGQASPFAASAAKAASSPAGLLKTLTGQQLLADPKKSMAAINVATGLQKLTGEDITMKQKFNPDDSVKNILAMRVLKNRLDGIMKLKNEIDAKGPVNMFFKSAADTGPIAGRAWGATSEFSGTGTEKPIGLLSTLIGAKYPKQQGDRAVFESALKELQEVGFFKGGKQLTGRELAVTVGPLPSKYDDDDAFVGKAERASSVTVPESIKANVQILLDVGWSPDDVKALLDMSDDQVQKLYDSVNIKTKEESGIANERRNSK